ncbi:MAG: PEP-CTERM sorting domain-containing protein [Akkermansiaceae bacterium]|nr:PEP-CTERM sorting domain-containing protein [Akkermansiaceae bacterium]
MKTISNSKTKLALVLMTSLLTTGLHAAVTLTASMPGGVGWNNSGYWSDGLAPHSGGDYLVSSNYSLRTPTGSPGDTFGGDSLTFSTGSLGIVAGDGTTTTINNLSFTGNASVGLSSGGSKSLAGTMDIADGVQVNFFNGNSDTRVLTLTTLLSGAGTIRVGVGSTDAVGSTVNIVNAANTWAGNILMAQGTLNIANNLYAADYVFTGDDGIFHLNAGKTYTFGEGSTLNGTSLAIGTYTATELNDLALGGTEFTGTGTFAVVPEPSSAVLLCGGIITLALSRRRL